jgi:hypothetical protein
METVKVNVDVSEITDWLMQYDEAIASIPMPVIGELLAGAVEDTIQSEGFGGWEPLSPNTLKLRPRRIGGQLLQDRGLLADIQTRDGYNWAEAWSPAPYAGFHITGTEHMDARDWTDINWAELLNSVEEFVMDRVVQ